MGAVHEQPASCALPPREDGDAWRALCLGGGAEGDAEGEDGDGVYGQSADGDATAAVNS